MKTLYLIRHAKSSWEDPDLDDMDRPLNKRGLGDAPKMGMRLEKQGVFPDLVITSPAERAYRTCEVISDILEYPPGAIEINEDVYHANERELLVVVRSCDPIWNTIMLFGHNPGLTDFANVLTNENIDNIPTCGIFTCTFDVEDWMDIEFGTGKLKTFDYPKKESSYS